ncbi:spindle apparatus coiled-coil protein 1 spindly [Andrena cerasifolii]|uniref:spindle apparatus coiled-coil protein 1 spindly n=1 Tax=Andrena cerasifolii TaxID=2819439 RepID=UPI00403812CE
MSTSRLIDEENNEEYTKENSERSSGRCCHLLEIEYERCRQEIHDLKRKLDLDEAMLREVREANEIHEHSLDRRISEKEKIIFQTEEKYRAITKEYDNVVSNLETKLAEQTTEIQKLRNETECLRAMDRSTPQTDVSLRVEDGSPTSLRNRIDELVVLLQTEQHRSECSEETIKQLQIRCNELECISRNMEDQLDERSTALENARAQLILGRAAAVSLEADPAHELCKGNSLFAEVEDRRQNVLGKMNTLREKYAEAKRTCKAQMAEIKILRAKRVETLGQWKNDAGRTRWSENDQLIQKYKDRISDLEGKLKSEMKKTSDTKELNNCAHPSFEYFQSLLDAKRKETNELRVKIEDLSTQMLIQEEAKTNIMKELRYWQCKAFCLEEQTGALQAKLKLDLLDDAGRKGVSRTDFEEHTPHRKTEVTTRETEAISKQLHISQTFHPSPLLNIVSETEDTTCHPLKSLRECKVMEKTNSKEKANHNGATESEAIPLNESCELKHARNTDHGKDKYSKKMVRFADKSITEESNDDVKKSPEAHHKYPVVYIPVVDSNS